jgi:hypothetical protein
MRRIAVYEKSLFQHLSSFPNDRLKTLYLGKKYLLLVNGGNKGQKNIQKKD